MAEVPVLSSVGRIVAKASWDYRWRRFALVVVIFGYGLWSLYDGYVKMPRDNREFHIKFPGAEIPPHPALDIPFNQWMGKCLPPLAFVFLGWVLHSSRGQYRLEDGTLSIPGHPDVSVKSIRRIDRSNWDRKGIAYLHYQVAGSSKLGVIKIDDFIYDRRPTDAIFDFVERAVEESKTAVAVNAPIPGSVVSGGPS